jgi:hypothetical protein
MPAPKRGGGSGKTAEKTPTASHTSAKNASLKGGLLGLIKPSQGGSTQAKKKKELKYAKEHSIRYFIFNINEDANAVGVLLYGERDLHLSSWMSKIVDNVVRQETGDFEPIPFFNGTFFLHDNQGKVVKHDRDQ